jgi:hypothetical protein
MKSRIPQTGTTCLPYTLHSCQTRPKQGIAIMDDRAAYFHTLVPTPGVQSRRRRQACQLVNAATPSRAPRYGRTCPSAPRRTGPGDGSSSPAAVAPHDGAVEARQWQSRLKPDISSSLLQSVTACTAVTARDPPNLHAAADLPAGSRRRTRMEMLYRPGLAGWGLPAGCRETPWRHGQAGGTLRACRSGGLI